MFKKKKAIRKVNMVVEEPEEVTELPEYEDEIVEAVEEQQVQPVPVREQPVQPKTVSKPKLIQVPVFLTQADINKMTYENNVMLREILELVKEE